MAERKTYLSTAQQLEFISVSESIIDDELEFYYTLTAEDIQIINTHRGQENRLGFAMTLCCLRHKGWPYLSMESVPNKVVSHVATQLSASPSALSGYGEKRTNKSFHLMEICSYYGYRQEDAWPELSRFIAECSHRLNDLTAILKETVRFAISLKIIPPKVTALARMAHEAISLEEGRIFTSVSSNLLEHQKKLLDNLLESSKGNTSSLFEMKDVSGRWNSSSFIELAEKLGNIRKLGIPDTFKDIHPNLLKSLSKQAYRYTPYRLKRFSDDKRHALLAILVHQQRTWLTDMAVDLNDKILMMMESDAKKSASSFLMDKKDEIDRNYRYFHMLGESIYDALENGTDLRSVIEKLTTKDELRSKLDSNFTPHEGDKNYFEKMISRYSVLRRYIPSMLANITFNSTGTSSAELLSALNIIGKCFEKKASILPDDIPTTFLAKDWSQSIKDKNGALRKDAYVVAVMLELRRQIRSGDIWVKYSYKYSSLESLLVPEDRVDFESLGVGTCFADYIERRSNDLKTVYKTIESDLESFSSLKKKDNRLHPERLENEVPDGVKPLNAGLYSLLPRVTLSEMIFEVNKWTGFMQDFTHLSTHQRPLPKDEPAIAAALSALGMNIGLQKMAESSDDVNYGSLFTVSNWRLYDETLKRAQATLVNYQHHLPLARIWGDGSTSSSDGMRVVCGVRSLFASHNPHYGSAQGVTMYRHTSDEYSAFYVNVINTNIRDAVHVIDGVLHHESELDIERHYTDTAGYTDQIFGLSHLLGFMFAPRIRDISDSKLYVLPEVAVPDFLSDIEMRRVNTKIIEENFSEVLRVAFSIKAGYVSCDMVMSRLGSYSRQNAIARALTEMGRIEKTVFLLKYFTDTKLRREILIGLNKGEAMNGLARAIFFGKSGNLREKDLQDQMQRASCLNILINTVVIWNTVYLQKAIEYRKVNGGLDESLLAHISPLNWNHIQLYGRYYFKSDSSLDQNQYRDLCVLNDDNEIDFREMDE